MSYAELEHFYEGLVARARRPSTRWCKAPRRSGLASAACSTSPSWGCCRPRPTAGATSPSFTLPGMACRKPARPSGFAPASTLTAGPMSQKWPAPASPPQPHSDARRRLVCSLYPDHGSQGRSGKGFCLNEQGPDCAWDFAVRRFSASSVIPRHPVWLPGKPSHLPSSPRHSGGPFPLKARYPPRSLPGTSPEPRRSTLDPDRGYYGEAPARFRGDSGGASTRQGRAGEGSSGALQGCGQSPCQSGGMRRTPHASRLSPPASELAKPLDCAVCPRFLAYSQLLQAEPTTLSIAQRCP